MLESKVGRPKHKNQIKGDALRALLIKSVMFLECLLLTGK